MELKQDNYTFTTPQTENHLNVNKRPTKEQYQKIRNRQNQSGSFNNQIKKPSPEKYREILKKRRNQ